MGGKNKEETYKLLIEKTNKRKINIREHSSVLSIHVYGIYNIFTRYHDSDFVCMVYIIYLPGIMILTLFVWYI